MLTEEEVRAIIEQIESNRFSKSWRTNRQHKAYLKEKHSNPSKNTNKLPSSNCNGQLVATTADKLTPELIVKETDKRATLKSREVPRWSGQTEIESSELPLDSLNTQQTITPYDMANKVFMTPFEIVEPEPQTNKPAKVDIADHTASLTQTPTCPRCNGKMIKRVAKKGLNQGQTFFGCSQFPKCRGVVNID